MYGAYGRVCAPQNVIDYFDHQPHLHTHTNLHTYVRQQPRERVVLFAKMDARVVAIMLSCRAAKSDYSVRGAPSEVELSLFIHCIATDFLNSRAFRAFREETLVTKPRVRGAQSSY